MCQSLSETGAVLGLSAIQPDETRKNNVETWELGWTMSVGVCLWSPPLKGAGLITDGVDEPGSV